MRLPPWFTFLHGLALLVFAAFVAQLCRVMWPVIELLILIIFVPAHEVR